MKFMRFFGIYWITVREIFSSDDFYKKRYLNALFKFLVLGIELFQPTSLVRMTLL